MEGLDSQVHHLTRQSAEERITTRERFVTIERKLSALEISVAGQVEVLKRVEDSLRHARGFFTALLVAVIGAGVAVLFQMRR